jgi:hypothetical protein
MGFNWKLKRPKCRSMLARDIVGGKSIKHEFDQLCGRERERPRRGRPVSAVASTAVDRPPVSHQIPLDLIDSSSIIGRFRGSSSDTGQGVFSLLPLRSQNSQRTVPCDSKETEENSRTQ